MGRVAPLIGFQELLRRLAGIVREPAAHVLGGEGLDYLDGG